MSAAVIRAHAAHLPLPDASVDLIVTSPPYFGLRSYTDGGEHYAGQIGSEATPGEWLDALAACTAEWVRVLKPEGSLFVNLGDKYVADNRGSGYDAKRGPAKHAPAGPLGYLGRDMARHKSLLGLPWRYALRCTDQLGLILRAEIIWAKPNGLPESVTDRVRRAHEQVFHFTRQPRYYSAVDEIREDYAPASLASYSRGGLVASVGSATHPSKANGQRQRRDGDEESWRGNPLGKLPGSVWSIPSQPLTVPPHLGVDHFAAFPMELPRRLILGWSPPGVCTRCGQGRRPVVDKGANGRIEDPSSWSETTAYFPAEGRKPIIKTTFQRDVTTTITGYACACPRQERRDGERSDAPDHRAPGWAVNGGLPPTRPSVVLDPFGGTGTTALIASVLGRHGITADLSADYCRLAAWRTTDPGERARALQVPKPPPVPDGQEALFP